LRPARSPLTYRDGRAGLPYRARIGKAEVRYILSEDDKKALLLRLRRIFAWGRANLPFGLRTVLGLVLVVGGVFGFLPVLGFWMIPLGLVLIALDVPPLRRRLHSWLHRALRRREDGPPRGPGKREQ